MSHIPIALAVLMFTIVTNLSARSTGTSPGFAPLKSCDQAWRSMLEELGASRRRMKRRIVMSIIYFSAHLYRARISSNGPYNKIKQCRGVAIRYDKFAAKHLAVIKLASIRI
jgi:hypothetical protein